MAQPSCVARKSGTTQKLPVTAQHHRLKKVPDDDASLQTLKVRDSNLDFYRNIIHLYKVDFDSKSETRKWHIDVDAYVQQ